MCRAMDGPGTGAAFECRNSVRICREYQYGSVSSDIHYPLIGRDAIGQPTISMSNEVLYIFTAPSMSKLPGQHTACLQEPTAAQRPHLGSIMSELFLLFP